MQTRRRTLILLAACAALWGAGCAVNQYRAPVGSFRARVQAGTAAIGDFYRSRNGYERKLYLLDLYVNKDKEALLRDAQGQPTPIGKPVFAEDAIEARLDALDLVGAYADRLAALAGSSAPEDVANAATRLGTNLGSLGERFQKLAGPGKDPTASRYIGPVSSLIGIVAQSVLEARRDQFIREAVEKGSEPVDAILKQIRDDLDQVFRPQESTGQREILTDWMTYYNQNRRSLSDEERRKLLDQIDDTLSSQTAGVEGPLQLVDAIADAHHALIKLVRSPRKGGNFREFNASLELFGNRVQSISQQVRTLRGL